VEKWNLFYCRADHYISASIMGQSLILFFGNRPMTCPRDSYSWGRRFNPGSRYTENQQVTM